MNNAKGILMALMLAPLMALAGSDLYMVVDLSGGTTATPYPISYLSDVPSGGWTDEYKTTKLVLRRIEPGTCVVTTDEPYYIGVFEVTQKQYELITGETPSYFSGNDKRPVEQVSYNMLRGTDKGAQYPDSTDVDDDSVMGKLRSRTAIRFDLPTEAQWEYACRAGTATTYSYGDTANGDYMWYSVNSGSCSHDVGTRKSNEWGLYDMHGNACEFCLNWSTDVGYEDCRVVRSGAWYFSEDDCTSSHLFSTQPSSVNERDGFRLVANLDSTLSDGLVAWYKFDGDAKDSTTNGNDGVVHGATLTTDKNDDENGAYHFNGSSWIAVNNSDVLTAIHNTITVSAWVKLSNSGGACIFCKGTDYKLRQYGFVVDTELSAKSNYTINDGGSYGTKYGDIMLYSSSPIPVGAWHCVAMTYDGSTVVAYLDGRQVGSKSVVGYFPEVSGGLLIGKDPPGSLEYLTGDLDDIRIYNRPLSATEVASLYESEKPIVKIWTVAFDACGGVASTETISVTNKTAIAELPTAERSGHKFLGWYTEKIEGKQVTSETIITSNATFYAHWRDLSKEFLVAHYEFNGNANDATTNRHDGVVQGATLTTDRFGNPNSAYKFGMDKYISVANDTQLENVRDNVTISAWICPTSWDANNGYMALLCKGSGNIGARNMSFAFNKSKSSFETAICFDYVAVSQLPTLNQWQHVAYTSDGNVIKVYLNGKLVGSSEKSLGTEMNTEPLTLGRDEVSSTEHFVGSMDDIRIYNYALSEDDIVAMYHEDDVAEFVCTQYNFNTRPSTLSAAESYIADSSKLAANPFANTYRTVAFAIDASASEPKFDTIPFPGGAVDYFALTAYAKIYIPEAGTWTFACGSDDGFRLKLSAQGYAESMEYSSERSYSITLKQFAIPAAGIYDLNLMHFNATGPAFCELSVAKGAYSSFDSAAFKLVGTSDSGITLVGKVLNHVTFDACGGTSSMSLKKVEQNTTLGVLPTVEREPYGFLGWFTTEEVGGDVVLPDAVVTNDMTVYAHWSAPTIESVVGATNVLWRTGGDAVWATEETDDGWDVRSGVIGKNSETWVECVVTNGCRVTFDWKASCEPDDEGEMYDYLSFAIDGEDVAAICGETDWANCVFTVAGEGEHTLRWTYQKDYRTSEGEDCGWLGRVKVDPEVSVTFDGNGATSGEVPTMATAYWGDEVTIPGCGTLMKSCHTFGGWQLGDTIYSEGEALKVETNVVAFVAVWNAKMLAQVTLATPETPHVTTEKIGISFNMPENATTIRYTLDGSEPTINSPIYEGAFEVGSKSVTVKAIAYAEDWFNSACAPWELTRAPWSAAECLNVEMRDFTFGGNADWVRDLDVTHDGEAAMRSGAIGDKQKSLISMSVVGAGSVSFWCRVSSECDPDDGTAYDGLVILVDGEEVCDNLIGGEVDWTNITVVVTGEGVHTIGWRYEKDKTGSAGEDCAWLDEVLWQVDETIVTAVETGSKDVVIGRDWIEKDLVNRYGAGKTDEFRAQFGSDFDLAVRKPNGKTVNGTDGVVWQDYVAGTDPTDTNSVFSSLIEMVDGLPVITWKPDLNEGGTKDEREYKIWGSTNLENGGEWQCPTNATHRFFKVSVEMK